MPPSSGLSSHSPRNRGLGDRMPSGGRSATSSAPLGPAPPSPSATPLAPANAPTSAAIDAAASNNTSSDAQRKTFNSSLASSPLPGRSPASPPTAARRYLPRVSNLAPVTSSDKPASYGDAARKRLRAESAVERAAESVRIAAAWFSDGAAPPLPSPLASASGALDAKAFPTSPGSDAILVSLCASSAAWNALSAAARRWGLSRGIAFLGSSLRFGGTHAISVSCPPGAVRELAKRWCAACVEMRLAGSAGLAPLASDVLPVAFRVGAGEEGRCG